MITGEIFVNAKIWNALSDAQKARVILEEISHQNRILMHSVPVLRYLRKGLQNVFHLARFNEEALAAYDATGSIGEALRYGWNYSGISTWEIAKELGFGTVVHGGLGYVFYQFDADDQ